MIGRVARMFSFALRCLMFYVVFSFISYLFDRSLIALYALLEINFLQTIKPQYLSLMACPHSSSPQHFLQCLKSPVMTMVVPTHYQLVLPILCSLYCYCFPINVLGILVLCFPSRTFLCVQLVSFL